MPDRSNFWKLVDRTKPSKLRVLAESELRDCQEYFLEIQSDSTLPPNEVITASERLTLIRSEIDRRHADANHGRTQRLARWAIAAGMLSLAVASISGVTQCLANKRSRENWHAEIESPVVATPTPTQLATVAPALTITPTPGTPDVTATPTGANVTASTPSPTPTEQRRKKRRTRPEKKRKTDQAGRVGEIFRSLFRPKPTPVGNQR
jgi:hypothetical protein